jgi:hypothetical protein
VTGQDIMLATKIYGKDVASLQGKTKDMGPTADVRMYVHPMEQSNKWSTMMYSTGERYHSYCLLSNHYDYE